MQYPDFTVKTVAHNHVPVSLSIGGFHYKAILQRVLISEHNAVNQRYGLANLFEVVIYCK